MLLALDSHEFEDESPTHRLARRPQLASPPHPSPTTHPSDSPSHRLSFVSHTDPASSALPARLEPLPAAFEFGKAAAIAPDFSTNDRRVTSYRDSNDPGLGKHEADCAPARNQLAAPHKATVDSVAAFLGVDRFFAKSLLHSLACSKFQVWRLDVVALIVIFIIHAALLLIESYFDELLLHFMKLF